MRVLITAGGTREYIDDVRVLTNISTGKLGATIATDLVKSIWSGDWQFDVTYVSAKGAVIPRDLEHYIDLARCQHIQIQDVASLMEVMRQQVPKHDVVIHTMAVSDFGFKNSKGIKLKSNSPEAFVEHLRQNITVNPKVISHIKQWNPNCKLISFKFEVGQTKENLLQIAAESLLKNDGDIVFANDKAEMEARKEHIAYEIVPGEPVSDLFPRFECQGKPFTYTALNGKSQIAGAIWRYLHQLTLDKEKKCLHG